VNLGSRENEIGPTVVPVNLWSSENANGHTVGTHLQGILVSLEC